MSYADDDTNKVLYQATESALPVDFSETPSDSFGNANDEVESVKKCSNPSKLAFTSFIFFCSDSFSLNRDNDVLASPLLLSIVAIPFLYVSNSDTL